MPISMVCFKGSLREIVRYAEKRKMRVMLEDLPLSNGIHDVVEFKYIIDNVPSLLVHLDIPHAFTSGGMKLALDNHGKKMSIFRYVKA